MKIRHRFNRRSFLASVGGTVVGGSALGLVSGRAMAFVQGCSDTDSGTGADPGGQGRRCQSMPHTGVTDSDSGAGADPGGRGRGGSRPSTGVSDSDTGAGADPAGRGRGAQRPAEDDEYLDRYGRRPPPEGYVDCSRLPEVERQLQLASWSDDDVNQAWQAHARWVQIEAEIRALSRDDWFYDSKYVSRVEEAQGIAARYNVNCTFASPESCHYRLEQMIRTAMRARVDRPSLEQERDRLVAHCRR